MTHTKQIKSALISVFDKTGLEPIIKALHQNNVTIYSTGGTEDFIKNLVLELNKISQIITSYAIETTTLKSKENLIF